MFSINSFSLAKLNNAEFVGYFVNVNKVIDEAGAENLGLEASMTTHFSDLLQKLIDQVYTARGSEYTAAMQAADSKRDQVYKRIQLRLQMVQVAEEHSELLGCKDVVEKLILAKYGMGVTSMPQHEESAVLQGFCYDLRDKLDEDQLDVLGITSDLSRLEQANNAFINAYNSRSNERAAGDTGLTVKLRGEMTEVYQQIAFAVQFYANSGQADHATKATACQGYIQTINVMLADVKKRWMSRTGGSAEDGADADENENGGGNAGQQSGGDGGANGSAGNTGSTGESGNTGGTGSTGGKVPVEL